MSATGSLALLGQRRFGPFFWTQFLGAFNDNLFKNALVILLAFQAARFGIEEPEVFINLSAGLFILPFFLFSAFAGQLADKFEKSRLIRVIKFAEILIMALGAAGFLLQSPALLIATLFLMGTQSALFGPVKYGILPQHLASDELVAGNGLVESGTFVAILTGTLLAGMLAGFGTTGLGFVAAAVVFIAGAGYYMSRRVPVAAPVAPELKLNWNPLSETLRTLKFAHPNAAVFNAILGISWFWFFGAMVLTQIPSYTRLILGAGEGTGTLLLAIFSIGIGLGSLLCDRLSGQKVEIGLVPFGAFGLTIFGVDLFFAAPALSAMPGTATLPEFLGIWSNWRILADMFLLSLFGGFFIVPLYALVQQRGPAKHLSRIIAANNVLNALAMVVAAGMGAALLGLAGLNVAELLLVAAIMNLAVAIYIFTLVPEFLMRFLAWMLMHALYRIRKVDTHHIPEQGAAVLVSNHVSFIDALIIMSCSRRPIRFVMYHKIFQIPVLSFIFRTANAIPIAPANEDRKLLEKAFDEIAAALEQGELVCIFPEGKLTGDGEMAAFRSGIERIVRRTPVPVIPLALKGLWGSFFSRKNGPAMLKLPKGIRRRLEVLADEPVPPEACTASLLQNRVGALLEARS